MSVDVVVIVPTTVTNSTTLSTTTTTQADTIDNSSKTAANVCTTVVHAAEDMIAESIDSAASNGTGILNSKTSASLSSSSSPCESGIIFSNSSINSSFANSPTNSPSSSLSSITAQTIVADGSAAALLTKSLLSSSPSVTTIAPAQIMNIISSTECIKKLCNQQQQQQHHHQQDSQQQQHRTGSSPFSEDPRTLQLALELSLVGLTDTDQQHYHFQQQLQQQQQQQFALPIHLHQQQQTLTQFQDQQKQPQNDFDLSSLNAITAAIAAATSAAAAASSRPCAQFSNSTISTSVTGLLAPPTMLEDRSKKSQNMTECVPVPSSEHVAEIVGRQGCKIKALRAKTNTYIKTPVRGEEPVFVVTGRKEDVNKAKREILSAADHFSLIRATRKPSIEACNQSSSNSNNSIGAGGGVGLSGGRTPSCPPILPGQVTIQVRVPYRVVGLVVGPKGATIKHIQQETQTYIVTPSREKEPIFEVTGLPENVRSARKQIEAHIALRTGQTNGSGGPILSAVENNGGVGGGGVVDEGVVSINALSQILNDDINPDFLASLYKNGICSTLDYNTVEDNGEFGCGNCESDATICNNTSLNYATADMNSVSNTGANQLLLSAITAGNCFPSQPQQQQQNRTEYLNAMIKHNDDLRTQQMEKIEFLKHNNNNGLSYNNNNNRAIMKNIQTINNNTIGVANIHHSTAAALINHATNGLTRSCSSASSTASTRSNGGGGGGGGGSGSNNSLNSGSSPPELNNIWKNLGGGDSLDIDEGIGESPNIWALSTNLVALTGGANCSPTNSISPTDSLLNEQQQQQKQQRQQTNVAEHNIILQQQHTLYALEQQHQQPTSVVGTATGSTGMRRECFVCNEKEVTAALVPCGHNMFCMDCANQICISLDAACPICNLTVYHAMRILA